MADESRNPLELDVVVQKFTESAEALANVREQLRVLTELRETEDRQMPASKRRQSRLQASLPRPQTS